METFQTFAGQASPVLEGITEEGIEAVPELLNVPPPPPRKAQPELPLDPAPETPDIPPSDDLSGFIPPTPFLEGNDHRCCTHEALKQRFNYNIASYSFIFHPQGSPFLLSSQRPTP